MSMEVRYYDEELGVENTAEGFLQEINYYNSPDDIPILQYIIETLKIDHQINSPIMQSPITENDIRKAQYHLDDIIEHRDYPNAEFYINSMKQDILSGLTRFESFYLDENTKLPITMVYDQNNPEKQWKITDEDWRNREKWDLYEAAIDEMLQKTSTTFAPWYILESVDKKYARIKALKIVIREIEKGLKRKGEDV